MNPRSRLIHSTGLHTIQVVMKMACQALQTLDLNEAWELVTDLIGDGTFKHFSHDVIVRRPDGSIDRETRTMVHCGHRNDGMSRLITDGDLLQENLQRTLGGMPSIVQKSISHSASIRYAFNEEIVNIIKGMQTGEDASILLGRSHEDHGSDLDLLLQEWERGVRTFYQPMRLEARRQRMHVDGNGVSFQGSDPCRAIIQYAEGKKVGGAELEFVLDLVGQEFDLTLEKAYKIRAAGADFFRNPQKYGAKKKKMFQTFAHSIGLIDAVNGLPVCAIPYMDASQSGFQSSAMTYGCHVLATLTNLSGGPKQDFYGSVLQGVSLPASLEPYFEKFLSRDMSKFLTTRIGYGAARQSLRAALLFKEAKKLDFDVVNQFGCLSDEAIKALISKRGASLLNPDFASIWLSLGWQTAFDVTGLLARQWEDSIYTISPRLREGMQCLRNAAKLVLEDNRILKIHSLTGMEYSLFAPVPDPSKPTVRFRKKVNGKEVSCTIRPMMNGATPSMFPPDFHHHNGDAGIMHMVYVMCKEAGMAVSGIHDAGGTHYADAPRLKGAFRTGYKLVGPTLKPLFDSALAQAGVEDPNRCGGKPIDFSLLDNAEFFVH
jgi:hypothetical protein